MTTHQRNISITLGVAVIIFSGGIAITQTQMRAAAAATPSDNTSINSSGQTYAMSEVAKHKDSTSCWTTINGGVYDVTSWIVQHPGGQDAILSLCGIDGSSAFNDQHGGQARPAEELASFKIGTLSSGQPTGKQ